MILRSNNYESFTVVVCGTEFSGSSLVAGSLRILGIPMGYEFYPEDTHQDVNFAKVEFDRSLLTAISTRNSSHFVWGFKWLALAGWLDQVFHALRNPVFIYCHRDLSSSLTRTNPKYSHAGVVEFANHIKEANYLADLLASSYVPLMVVEHFDKPKLFSELAEFTHCDLTETHINQLLAFSIGGYKPL